MIVREMPKKISKCFSPQILWLKYFGSIIYLRFTYFPSHLRKSTDFSLEIGSVDNKYLKRFYYSYWWVQR